MRGALWLAAWSAALFCGLSLGVCHFATGAVSIAEADYEGRPQFQVVTAGATYFYDRAGGGFSRLVDRDGRDWISFKREPLQEVPAAAAAGFRGIPNLLHGKDHPDAGAGHPGFDRCESVAIAPDTIRTTSRSGRWAWSWSFTDEYALLTIERADLDRPFWFLYEGTVGGRWLPAAHYWGTDAGGPQRDRPDGKSQLFGRWRWAYFGDDDASRVLLAVQVTPDEHPDTLWYMGSTADGLRSANGMIVFGFGRGPRGAKHLRGAGQQFLVGLVEGPVQDPDAHARVAEIARGWLADTAPAAEEGTLPPRKRD